METFLKIYLLIYLIIFLAAAFVWPSIRTYKHTGINPVTFGKSDNAHDFIGFVMKLLIILLFITVICYALLGEKYKYLLPLWYFEEKGIKISGFILIHVALIWVLFAQKQMSNSWRIGIDEKNKTKLVTHGVFSISRNPIFLGMMVCMWGLFLVLPNVITVFLAATTWFIIQIQIRLEEEFLEKQHGQDYTDYKSKTKRLI